MILTILMWVGFIIAAVVAIYVIIAGYLYATSPKVRCLVRTGHQNSEALGSVMRDDGPRFAYRCRDCGAVWTEPWNV